MSFLVHMSHSSNSCLHSLPLIIYLRRFRDISLYPIFHELPTRPTSPSYQYFPQYQLLATIIDIISVLTTTSVYSHLYGQCQWESLLCPWSHHRNYGLSNTGIQTMFDPRNTATYFYIFLWTKDFLLLYPWEGNK